MGTKARMMRRYTKPVFKKTHVLQKLLRALRLGKAVVITPKEKAILEGVYGMGLFLKHIKVNYKIVEVSAHYRRASRVTAHTRRLGHKYYLDVSSLIAEYGVDYLIEYLQGLLGDIKSRKIGILPQI